MTLCWSSEEGYTVSIRTQLHPTDRFYLHLDVLLEALDDNERFGADLAKTLKTLEAYNWDDNPSLKPHGKSGLEFSFPINDEFLLIFRRETDRNSEGKPSLAHFYLMTIERAKV
jgi:hypothetical protein